MDCKVDELKQTTINLEIETKYLGDEDEEKIRTVEEGVERNTREISMQGSDIKRVENNTTEQIEKVKTEVERKMEGQVNKVVEKVSDVSNIVENIEDGVNKRLEDLACRINVSM